MAWDISGSTAGIFKTRNADLRISRHHARTLVFIALTLSVLTGCDTESLLSSSSEADDALRILNTSSAVLAHVDIEAGITLAGDILPEGWFETEEIQRHLQEVISVTGIDPMQDISAAYLSLSRVEGAPDIGLVLFVDFDQDGLRSLIEERSRAIPIESIWPVHAYRSDSSRVSFALVEASMILLSNSEERLAEMLDRAFSDDLPPPSDALLSRVGRHDSWIVVRGLDELDFAGSVAEFAPFARAIQDAGAAVDVSVDEARIHAWIQPKPGVDPRDLESIVRGIRALARTQLASQPELLELLEDIDISTSDGLVEISVSLDEGDIKRFGSEFAGQFHRKKAG